MVLLLVVVQRGSEDLGEAGACDWRRRERSVPLYALEVVLLDTIASRRGRAAARSEWRLAIAAHNLLKLWRHTTTPMAA